MLDFEKYTHVIWDWNGTILNDAELCFAIVNEMLAAEGREALPIEEHREIFEFPVQKYYEKLGYQFQGGEGFNEISRQFIDAYVSRVSECALNPGIENCLKQFDEIDMSQVILSATLLEQLLRIIPKHNISHYFEEVMALDHARAHGKLEIGRTWMAECSHSPENTLLIGDTLHDFEVAEALGADCLLVASGQQSRERLETADIKVVDSIDEIWG